MHMQEIMNHPIAMIVIIFVVNIVYVTFLTMRTIMTLKGYRYVAAGFSVLEILVYVIGLGLVLDNLDNFFNVIAYALGFGVGIIVGLKIEEMLALGYLVVNVTISGKEPDMPNQLRNLGYGVTHYFAYGRDGQRTVMQILTPRKYERKLMATIKELDDKAFIITYEPININGGFWVKGVRRKRLAQYEPEEL